MAKRKTYKTIGGVLRSFDAELQRIKDNARGRIVDAEKFWRLKLNGLLPQGEVLGLIKDSEKPLAGIERLMKSNPDGEANQNLLAIKRHLKRPKSSFIGAEGGEVRSGYVSGGVSGGKCRRTIYRGHTITERDDVFVITNREGKQVGVRASEQEALTLVNDILARPERETA